jgi:Helicase HerA, central domain
MKQARMEASIQHDFLVLRETSGDMLCLYTPGSPTRRSYRAVLEVSPINLSLKAEDEQEAIIERFGALIRSLSFPLQVLVRSQRLDLSPNIRQVLAQESTSGHHAPGHHALALALADLLQRIAAGRTLIERHIYVIIPASQGLGRSRQRGRRGAGLFGRRRGQRLAETQEQARQELALRTEALSQQLASCGLTCRRLHNADLARLFYQCLTPERAIAHPLSDALLSAVGRPTRVKRRPGRVPPDGSMQPIGSDNHNGASFWPASDAQRVPLAGVATSAQGAVRREPSDDLPSLPPPDLLPLVDLLAPECVEVLPDALRIGEEYTCGVAVTAYPREVSFDGWLAPLLLHDEVFDLAFHYHPQDTAAMKRTLSRNRAGHASGRQFNRREGRADDPDALVAEEDIRRLLDDLARSRERVFDLGCYLLLRASTKEALAERMARLYAVLGLLSLDAAAHSTTFEQAEALQSCLPQARDELLRTCTLDSTTCASMFPFQSNSLIMPDGVLVGISQTHEPVLLNPWDGSLENPHVFIGGVTGSGKSYLGKLLVERDLLQHWQRGDESVVIDPDLEYLALAESLGGTVVRLAPGSVHRLNPFDLLPPRCDLRAYLREAQKGDRLAEKIQDLHALLDLLLAEDVSPASSGSSGMLTKREKGLIDQALYETYQRAGITSDPRTHHREPPLLRDLYEVLRSGVCGPDETDLAGRLSRYVSGSLSSLFSAQTSVDLARRLVVWDIRDMRGELRPLAIALIAERVWTQTLYARAIPRALYIDEAASLIEHPAGGQFLASLSRRARKRYLRLVTMTQNPERFVQDPWGSVVAANAAIKVLKTQDATSAAAVAERFRLTRSEQQRLITCGSHEALLLAGGKRVLITIPASPREHALITTNPVERAEEDASDNYTDYKIPQEADGASLDASQLALSRQKTGPLVPLGALQKEAAVGATASQGTNHRQSGEKRGAERKEQED